MIKPTNKIILASFLTLAFLFSAGAAYASLTFGPNSITSADDVTIKGDLNVVASDDNSLIVTDQDTKLIRIGNNADADESTYFRNPSVEVNVTETDSSHFLKSGFAVVATETPSADFVTLPASAYVGIYSETNINGSFNYDKIHAYGIRADLNSNATGIEVDSLEGVVAYPYNSATQHLDDIVGFETEPETDTGTVGVIAGMRIWPADIYGGAVTDNYGIQIESPYMEGGTLDNFYAIKVEDLSGFSTIGVKQVFNYIDKFIIAADGSIQIKTTGGQPTCSSTTRFTFWTVPGGAGVKDNV